MHAHLEEGVSRSDCGGHTLSWMGKVPETLPDEEGWKLNRVNYYQEGWLATGNARGIVGATYSWHINMDQVYVCENGVSVQTGFPNGLFDKLAEGAEFGRCEHID